MTIAELSKIYRYIDWLEFINAETHASIKFNDSEKFIVQQPTYFDQLESVLSQTDRRTIANFVIWRDLSEFFEIIAGWESCVDLTSSILPIPVSAMYVREHFWDRRMKDDGIKITKEVSSEFAKMLKESDWMDNETRKEALKKLDKKEAQIAYPAELLDDAQSKNSIKTWQ